MGSNLPRIASRDEWLAAREALLAKEKEMTRARDALCAERRRLPMVDIDKRYVFEAPPARGRTTSSTSPRSAARRTGRSRRGARRALRSATPGIDD